jgi:hypothetical protein
MAGFQNRRPSYSITEQPTRCLSGDTVRIGFVAVTGLWPGLQPTTTHKPGLPKTGSFRTAFRGVLSHMKVALKKPTSTVLGSGEIPAKQIVEDLMLCNGGKYGGMVQ